MVELASDFLDREVPVFRDDVCIFVSQSGKQILVYFVMLFPRGLLTLKILYNVERCEIKMNQDCVTDRVIIFSGETTNTLDALRYCKRRDALVMGITNTGKR